MARLLVKSSAVPAYDEATGTYTMAKIAVGGSVSGNDLFRVTGNRSMFASNSNEFAIGLKYVIGDSAGFYLGSTSAGATLNISSLGGGTLTTMLQSGSWTWGVLSAGANYSAVKHFISGGLHAANVTSADGSGRLVIGVNSYRFGNTSDNARTDTTTGGMGILLNNRTLNANPGLEIYASQPGQGATVSSVIMSATHDGIWTYTRADATSYSGTTVTGVIASLVNSTNSGNSTIVFSSKDGLGAANTFNITSYQPSNANPYLIIQNTVTGVTKEVLTISSAGACAFGPSSTTTYHTVNGTLLSKAAANGFQSAFAAQDVLRLTANIYLDLGSNTERNIAAGFGYAALEINRPAADTDVVYRFRSNYQDTQNAAGSSLVITNNKTLGTVTASGAWTFTDIASISASIATFGGDSLENNGAEAITIRTKGTGTSARATLAARSGGSLRWRIGSSLGTGFMTDSSPNDFCIQTNSQAIFMSADNGTTAHAKMTPAGDWTLNPSTGNGIYTTINRLLNVANTSDYNVTVTSLTSTQLTASVVNSSNLTLTGSPGNFNLDGLVALPRGTVLFIRNNTSNQMTITHNGAGNSTAIFTRDVASRTFASNTTAMLIYGTDRWQLIG